MELDLMFIIQGAKRTMSVGVAADDGSFEMIGPVDSQGAFDPLTRQLLERYPDLGTYDEVVLQLTVIHFRNMSRRENSVGQSYPFHIPG